MSKQTHVAGPFNSREDWMVRKALQDFAGRNPRVVTKGAHNFRYVYADPVPRARDYEVHKDPGAGLARHHLTSRV